MRPQDTGKASDTILDRVALESVFGGPWSTDVIWTALEMDTRQHAVGAAPKGPCHPVRPFDRRKSPDDIRDQEASESKKKCPHESAIRSESFLEGQEARRSLSICTGSLSHMATTRHWEGARCRSRRKAWESIFEGPLEYPRCSECVGDIHVESWSRSLQRVSVTQTLRPR